MHEIFRLFTKNVTDGELLQGWTGAFASENLAKTVGGAISNLPSIVIEPIQVFGSVEEWLATVYLSDNTLERLQVSDELRREVVRRRALRKLTPRERTALGLQP